MYQLEVYTVDGTYFIRRAREEQVGDLLQSRSGVLRVYFERGGEINFTDLVFR